MRYILAAVAACLFMPAVVLADENFPTGFYAGLTGGYSTASIGADSFDFAGDGLMGGIYGGFNYRLPGAVVGIEGDWMLTDIKAEENDAILTFTAKTKQLSSIRARAGVPLGPVLLYGTGGIAFTQAEVDLAAGSDDKMLTGWVAGAGVEVELTRTLQVRLEGLHYDFDDDRFTVGTASGDVGMSQTVVRAGLGIKLN